MPTHHCLEIFRCEPSVLKLPDEDRYRVVDQTLLVSKEGGFEKDAHAHKSPITLSEELIVMCVLGVVMGGPLVWLGGWACVLACGSWLHCLGYLALSLVLMFHPLPDVAAPLRRSHFSLLLYKCRKLLFVISHSHFFTSTNKAWQEPK